MVSMYDRRHDDRYCEWLRFLHCSMLSDLEFWCIFEVSYSHNNLKHPQVGRAVEECCYGGAAKLDLVVASEMLMKIF